MKVFAYGYSSGHGFIADTRRHALERQSDLMLHGLIADLDALPGIEVITLRDPRATALELPESVLVVPCDRTFSRSFSDCLKLADAVWLVAPETSGLLEHLTRKVVRHKRVLLGSRPAAVHIASSKLLCARLLSRSGVQVVDTYLVHDACMRDADAWVVKPDDGAGCLDTHIFGKLDDARAWMLARGEGHVLQPFVSGRPCSMSLLCRDGMAQVLSVNEHRVAVRNNQLHDLGCIVNSLDDPHGQWTVLANRITRAISGLWGYVGIDFIMTPGGPVVLEVNPRLTPSYVGLQAATGCNPAALVLGLLRGAERPELPPVRPGTASVDTDLFAVRA